MSVKDAGEKMPLPIMVTVRVGRGVVVGGQPYGEASGIMAMDVAHGLCAHEVTLHIMRNLVTVVDAALRDGLSNAGKTVKAGSEGEGNDKGPSELVA